MTKERKNTLRRVLTKAEEYKAWYLGELDPTRVTIGLTFDQLLRLITPTHKSATGTMLELAADATKKLLARPSLIGRLDQLFKGGQ